MNSGKLRRLLKLARPLLIGTALAAGGAWASHPMPPISLEQQYACGTATCTEIPPGTVVTSSSVQLRASSDDGTCLGNSYKLQLEVRPLNTAFTGTPTHTSQLKVPGEAPGTKPDCEVVAYPFALVTLAPGYYHWQVREEVGGKTSAWVPFRNGSLAFGIQDPNKADLVPRTVLTSNESATASSVSFDVTATLNNYGGVAANNVAWRVYLSTDTTQDASDPIIYTSSSPVSVAANSSTVLNASITLSPRPPNGRYVVLVEVDHPNSVPEFEETNNVRNSTMYLVTGVDLVAWVISGPATATPGTPLSIRLVYENEGLDGAATVQYRVLLSTNEIADTADSVLYSGTRTLNPQELVDETVTATVPSSAPGGEFYYLLQLDPVNAVSETAETNNVVASTSKVKLEQANLVVERVDFVDPVTGGPVQAGVFGQSARLQVTLRNVGTVDAGPFKVGVVLSRDSNLSLLSDHFVHDEPLSGLAANQTLVANIDFTLPIKDPANKDYRTGDYYFYAVADSFHQVGEMNEQDNTLAAGITRPEPVRLKAPAQDYAVLRVSGPSAAAAGEIIPGYRVIRNVGSVAGSPVTYRWFASANGIITPDDVPLSIVGPGGAITEAGSVTLGVGEEHGATELLKLPGHVPPGSYYLGCIVDFDQTAEELDEENNTLSSLATVQVAPLSLRVVTQQLPDAVLERGYQVRLSAAGETEPPSWSVDPSGGPLPDGLQLAADGTLAGTPAAVGVTGFTVVVESGGRTASARLALRVLPNTTELAITTRGLPPIANSPVIPYSASLGAVGGAVPYTWRISQGSLPNGITFAEDGTLSGAVRPGVPVGESRVTFTVSDPVGNQASASLMVRVVEPGALIIGTVGLPDAMVGKDYLADLSAQNVDGSPLATPLTWSVAAGALPAGLALESDGEQRGLLSGRPTFAGTYPITLQVEDAKGRADTMDFVLRVFPLQFRLFLAQPPPVFHPGDAVEVQIQATTSAAPLAFSLFSGRLPPGTSLTPDGKLSGTVEEDAEGIYNFVAEALDANGGKGLGAFTLEVQPRPRAVGCAAVGGGGALVAALASLGLLGRRRRAGSA